MASVGLPANEIVERLLDAGEGRFVSVLDSCGVGRRGSNLLIAGIDPVRVLDLSHQDPAAALAAFDEALSEGRRAAIFTISYEFGARLNRIKGAKVSDEPGIHLSLFDGLIIHDYDRNVSFTVGQIDKAHRLLSDPSRPHDLNQRGPRRIPSSNFDRGQYMRSVERVRELIREGQTYQTNLTQRFEVPLHQPPSDVFRALRDLHPSPFAAFIDRGLSTVVSGSPEQFLTVTGPAERRTIKASPIKGTRRRGLTPEEDVRLRDQLVNSSKDRAENTMIVDLMRNDLGRVCEFGSVNVEELCRVREHPSLFHLESTVAGRLRGNVAFSDIIRATFPCGSITGAPKIRTMEIIERLEPDPRGLSMGAIGIRVPAGWLGQDEVFETSVAIRTLVADGGRAVFNVGGGVVIDSDPEDEYEESLLKAKALFAALGVESGDLAAASE